MKKDLHWYQNKYIYKVIDLETNKTEKVLNETDSSVLVTRSKLSDMGINCTNWFTKIDFDKKFKKVLS